MIEIRVSEWPKLPEMRECGVGVQIELLLFNGENGSGQGYLMLPCVGATKKLQLHSVGQTKNKPMAMGRASHAIGVGGRARIATEDDIARSDDSLTASDESELIEIIGELPAIVVIGMWPQLVVFVIAENCDHSL